MGSLPPSQELERGSIDRVAYDLLLDLAGDDESTFFSRAEIRFRCQRPGSSAFADLRAVGVQRAELNGETLNLTTYRSGRLELPHLSAENTLIVEAEFGYDSARVGLHRHGETGGGGCVYSKAYPGGAPYIYCCFDEAGLRAPFTVSINAPAGWSCVANGPVVSRPPNGAAGRWKFATTHPIAPYLSSFCAGPFSGPARGWEREQHNAVPVTASALPSSVPALEAAVNLDMFRQPLSYYQRSLGVPYPYGKCDVVFVPAYRGLAFGAPGLITVKEQVVTEPPKGKHELYLATVIAHELAHAWFGGLIAFLPPEDGWIEETVTSYISRGALEEGFPGAVLWDEAASQTLPDHAYAPDAGKIRQLETLIGRQAVISGLSELLRRHAHGCASKDDLIQCWSRAADLDLRPWAAETLTPG